MQGQANATGLRGIVPNVLKVSAVILGVFYYAKYAEHVSLNRNYSLKYTVITVITVITVTNFHLVHFVIYIILLEKKRLRVIALKTDKILII